MGLISGHHCLRLTGRKQRAQSLTLAICLLVLLSNTVPGTAFDIISNDLSGDQLEDTSFEDIVERDLFSTEVGEGGTASVDVDEPLFITPLVESGRLGEARRLSRTTLGGVLSFSGYITINESCQSNLFFWFIPAKVDPNFAPVVVWLQGGPGVASTFGLLTEHGPFYVDIDNSTLKKRDYAWTTTHSVLYIDSPVGTGYSFAKSTSCYARNEEDVANGLYSLLVQFFVLFPWISTNDFYVTGESYAGKYVPAISYKIDQENAKNDTKLKINLKGLAIGNGYSDPKSMLHYGDYLYEIGMIDHIVRDAFHKSEDDIRSLIDKGKYEDASNLFDAMIGGGATGHSLFADATGFPDYYNYLYNASRAERGNETIFIQLNETRRAIHVGNKTWGGYLNREVTKALIRDDVQSVKPWIEILLEKYRVLFYNGQLDVICAYPLTVSFVKSLKWSGSEQYAKAERKIWRVGDDLAGYSKTVGNFTEILVRNAGHMVPTDQPKWAYDLISRFTSGKPF